MARRVGLTPKVRVSKAKAVAALSAAMRAASGAGPGMPVARGESWRA